MNPTQLLRATRVVCSELSRLGDQHFDAIVGVDTRESYTFQTGSPVTVSIQAKTPETVEVVAALFNLADVTGDILGSNYTFAADWPLMGIHVRAYGPQRDYDAEPADCYASELS